MGILFILGNVSFDLAGFLGAKQYIGGHIVLLGDIKVVAPVAMAALSAVLFSRTRGRYTKWLAVIIFARLLKIGIK